MSKHSILIVDDSLVDLEILSMVCSTMGCEVDGASNGQEAIELFREKQHTLVVSDYRMEPLNGIYVAASIRDINPNVQFLMVTGFPDEEVQKFVREYDIPAPVTKPISMTRLIGALKELLEGGAINTDHIHSGAFEERMKECPILLGDSELISNVRKNLSDFLLKDCPALIEGADGVGKLEIARLLHKYGPHRKGPCIEIQFTEDSINGAEEELFLPDGRWGQALERAKGGTLILQGVEQIDDIVAHRFIEQFTEITTVMRIIALEGCAVSLREEPVEMNRSLHASFMPHIVRVPEFSERTEDLVQIIQAVAASPIQYGLARLLGEDEVEQIAEELKLYDFEDNFLGLFERIRRMADRPRRTRN